MKTRVGTHRFATVADALRYYRPLGLTGTDVALKLSSGEIEVGPPPRRSADDRMGLDSDGRWWIEYAV